MKLFVTAFNMVTACLFGYLLKQEFGYGVAAHAAITVLIFMQFTIYFKI